MCRAGEPRASQNQSSLLLKTHNVSSFPSSFHAERQDVVMCVSDETAKKGAPAACIASFSPLNHRQCNASLFTSSSTLPQVTPAPGGKSLSKNVTSLSHTRKPLSSSSPPRPPLVLAAARESHRAEFLHPVCNESKCRGDALVMQQVRVE